jgi:hypothetical protein
MALIKLTFMEKLVLDYSKWRCGGWNKVAYGVGEGPTLLRNASGFMCCLGQWILQLRSDLNEKDITDVRTPMELKIHIPLFTFDTHNVFPTPFRNTEFANQAMSINDNPKTTVNEKIDQLHDLLEKQGLELEVINKPDSK